MRTSNGIALFALLVMGCGLASAVAFDGAQPGNVAPATGADGSPRTAMVGPMPSAAFMPWEPVLGPGLVLGFSNFRGADDALKLSPGEAFNWGMYALRIGNTSSGVRALEYSAANGHPIAQWKLGRMFADGDGVPRDQLRAFEYFGALADAHADDRPGTMLSFLVANAFVSLGTYYLEGIPNSHVKADAERARAMFFYAASYFGDRDAQYDLARMYLEGNSVPKDPKIAARWLSLAADKGQHLAQAVLGDMLVKGVNVTRRSALGLMWLTLAADAATPQEGWIVQLHDTASQQATEEDRALALTLLERRLRGERGE
jgi:uncharacterized protein